MKKQKINKEVYKLDNFDKRPAFSSFLPGLAGIKGIPLWVYYNNRGQGVTSFGIHHKDNAIMEFNPANTAYENTAIKGFRTFIKVDGEVFEPFFELDHKSERNIYIKKNSFEIEEINEEYGIRTLIKYYVLPNESIGALVRKVQIENIGSESRKIEVIDGLPKIIPYGISNTDYKGLSNLLKSWTEITNIDKNVPYYTMRSSSDDSAEVKDVSGGYFYLSTHKGAVLPVIYDGDIVFDYDHSLVNPVGFLEKPLEEIMEQEQCFYNKIPSGFTPIEFYLEPLEKFEFNTMTGFAENIEQVNEKLDAINGENYFEAKEVEADEIVNELTQDIKTASSNETFDMYLEQCYLDNFLRGGYPFIFNKDDNKAVVHLFNRKHGDPERDYNFFSIAGEYYSQGNGNFRDVSQNRRNDIFFNKDVGDFNIKTFFQLIQIDGYNPLEIRPSTFSVKEEHKDSVEKLINENIKEKSKEIFKIIDNRFTPGEVSNCLAREGITTVCDEDQLIASLLNYCDQNIEAGYGEGYWSDHWNYNLDLIESFLKIYPEKETELLFNDNSYRYYDSPAKVLARSEKYVLNGSGEVRQYGSLIHDEEKSALDGFNISGTNWLRTKDGEYASTTLMGKVIILALNKFALLDSHGMGVEMDAGKPGWNDAMNGIPGLFGSGMSETIELKRLVSFIRSTIKGVDEISLPTEVNTFMLDIAKELKALKEEEFDQFTYWDRVSTKREEFREEVRLGLLGSEVTVNTNDLLDIFNEIFEQIELGIEKALGYGDGIVPTYFTFKATEFEPVLDESGEAVISHYGLPKAKVKAFEAVALPAFLEGPTKMLSGLDGEEAKNLHKNVKKSELYDRKLKMYKTSVPLDDISMENGRIRAFTPGWLERESIFLHMEYKYLLSMLRGGLYKEFFEEITSTMVVFRDQKEYGRSVLENSSFIASSRNPDKSVHGRGYVSRLSGSTTEALSMWIDMFMGDEIFTWVNDELRLRFKPNLPGWFFDDNNQVAFTFLSNCRVVYINPEKKDTFGEGGAKIKNIVITDTNEVIEGDIIPSALAQKIRDGEIKEVVINLY